MSKANNIISVIFKVKNENENIKYDFKITFIFVNYYEKIINFIEMTFTRTVKFYFDFTFNFTTLKYTKN